VRVISLSIGERKVIIACWQASYHLSYLKRQFLLFHGRSWSLKPMLQQSNQFEYWFSLVKIPRGVYPELSVEGFEMTDY
jgi:hypothetical protein